MQTELADEFPELDIQILGCNEYGFQSGNPNATSSVDLPWLQDIDADENGNSDAWEDWSTQLRDYVIVDRSNVELFRLDLTFNSLAIPENYEMVKELMVDAANFTFLGDVDQDGSLTMSDVSPFVDAIVNDNFQFAADINRDGVVDLLDVHPFVGLLSEN